MMNAQYRLPLINFVNHFLWPDRSEGTYDISKDIQTPLGQANDLFDQKYFHSSSTHYKNIFDQEYLIVLAHTIGISL